MYTVSFIIIIIIIIIYYFLIKKICSQSPEGLACLNTYVHSPCKLLWRAALHYYSAVMANLLSFEDLYKDLEKYIDDGERRWSECLRVKRGFMEQTGPGCFCKDQVYLKGAIQILRERRNLDFRLLYSGKLCLEDIPRMKSLVRIDLDKVQLPYFIQDDPEDYMRELDEIERVNFSAGNLIEAGSTYSNGINVNSSNAMSSGQEACD